MTSISSGRKPVSTTGSSSCNLGTGRALAGRARACLAAVGVPALAAWRVVGAACAAAARVLGAAGAGAGEDAETRGATGSANAAFNGAAATTTDTGSNSDEVAIIEAGSRAGMARPGGSANNTKRRDIWDSQPTCSSTLTTGSSMLGLACTRTRTVVALVRSRLVSTKADCRSRSPIETSARTHFASSSSPTAICTGTLKSSGIPSTATVLDWPKPAAHAGAVPSARAAAMIASRARRFVCIKGLGYEAVG